MFGLDLRSVVVITGIMGLLMAVVFFFLRRSYPPSIRGLREWAIASLGFFVATVLFALRGVIPDFFCIVVPSLLMFSALLLAFFGTQRFLGFELRTGPWVGFFLVAALPTFWFSLVEPHHGVRVAINTAFVGILAFTQAWLILRHGARAFSNYFTAAALLVLATSMVLRFLSAFSLPAGDAIFDNTSPEQAAYISTYAFSILAGTIGLMLMATDKLHAELGHMAGHDSLTGALTRRALIEACDQELERSRRNHQTMSLLMMDLDHFKAVNDTHGHLVGDQVLVNFVARVKSLLRLPDRLGRFGGEEFVALLPETSLDEARVVAERLRAMIESNTGDMPLCTVSIGITVSRPDDGDLGEILARADAAMYQAKHAGRNRVESVVQRQQ